MKCNYCGAENKEDSKFCASCGAELKEKKKATKEEEVKVEKVEVKEVKPQPVKPESEKDGKATASLVLGIVSFVVWCVTPITSLIGLILGICAKKSGKKVAGIILNSIALAVSVICLLFCFWFGAVISAAIEEVGESGDFERFFEIIEEGIEEANENQGNNYVTPTIPTTPTTPAEDDDTKVVGTDHYGYVKVPKNWVAFKDVDNDSVYQYTDIGEAGYIVTLQTYEEDITALQAATNLQKKMKEEGAEVTLKTAIVGKYVAWVVDAKYSDDTYIDIYLFKADDKLRFVSIEGPDDTNENFSIPKTFSLTK